MVDATYVDIARAIRPGTRENELVAIANDRLFRMGSERVECVNSVSGPRGRPHSHTFSDRIIQPGDMVFLDIMHSLQRLPHLLLPHLHLRRAEQIPDRRLRDRVEVDLAPRST